MKKKSNLFMRLRYFWAEGEDMPIWKKFICCIFGIPFMFDEPDHIFLENYYKKFPLKKK